MSKLRVSIQQDAEGHVSFIFNGEFGAGESAPKTFSLCRQSDKCYLNPESGRWGSDIQKFSLEGCEVNNGQMEFLLPDKLIQLLLGRMTYRIELYLKNGEVLRTNANSDIYQPNIPKKEPPKEKPESNAEEPQKDEPTEKESKRPSKGLWILIGVLVIIAALAAAFFLLSGKDSSDAPKAQTSEEVKKEVKKEEKSEVKQEPEKKTSVREQVRDFFGQNSRNGKEALNLAKQIKVQSPEDEDALYRLYYFAANQGKEKDGLIGYANFLDPTTPLMGTIKKNAVEAWNSYKEAGAKQELSRLEKWLKENSQSNNEAQKWLKTLKQKGEINE